MALIMTRGGRLILAQDNGQRVIKMFVGVVLVPRQARLAQQLADAHDARPGPWNGRHNGQLMLMMLALAGPLDRTMGS